MREFADGLRKGLMFMWCLYGALCVALGIVSAIGWMVHSVCS